eukprot:25898-Eustigmatos_ZCMA.PRE.1
MRSLIAHIVDGCGSACSKTESLRASFFILKRQMMFAGRSDLEVPHGEDGFRLGDGVDVPPF